MFQSNIKLSEVREVFQGLLKFHPLFYVLGKSSLFKTQGLKILRVIITLLFVLLYVSSK